MMVVRARGILSVCRSLCIYLGSYFAQIELLELKFSARGGCRLADDGDGAW